MIKICKRCKQEFETEENEKKNFCPVCEKKLAPLGYGILLFIVIFFIFVFSNWDNAEKDEEGNARRYARYHILTQMRDSNGASFEWQSIRKTDGIWTAVGVAEGNNVFGGRSKHRFIVTLKHIDNEPWWKVLSSNIGSPY